MSLQELPGLVYQLLLLGAQQFGSERMPILAAVLEHFTALDAAAAGAAGAAGGAAGGDEEEDTYCSQPTASVSVSVSLDALWQVEGSVLHLFQFAATQDHGLGTAFLKILKGDAMHAVGCEGGQFPWLALTPFSAALALSLATGQRFEVPVFEALGRLAADGAKHAARLEARPWLRGLAGLLDGGGGGDGLCAARHAEAVPRVLASVVRGSSGWDRLAQPLVNLGFALVDKAPPADAPGGSGGTAGGGGVMESGGAAWGAALGADLLRATFLAHAVSQAAVVTGALNRVVTKAPGSAQLLDLLLRLSADAPDALADHGDKLRDTFG